ncbi:hypothetical protein NFI96_027666 [Prochilodus magdalenae]|nr:hypothetical protein NFI96_027666 [Prochilodus magdalenae]
MEEETTPVRQQHLFNLPKLQQHLAGRLIRAPDSPALSVRQYRAGQSNPTFLLQSPLRSYVLRKKPPGPLLPGAHKLQQVSFNSTGISETQVRHQSAGGGTTPGREARTPDSLLTFWPVDRGAVLLAPDLLLPEIPERLLCSVSGRWYPEAVPPTLICPVQQPYRTQRGDGGDDGNNDDDDDDGDSGDDGNDDDDGDGGDDGDDGNNDGDGDDSDDDDGDGDGGGDGDDGNDGNDDDDDGSDDGGDGDDGNDGNDDDDGDGDDGNDGNDDDDGDGDGDDGNDDDDGDGDDGNDGNDDDDGDDGNDGDLIWWFPGDDDSDVMMMMGVMMVIGRSFYIMEHVKVGALVLHTSMMITTRSCDSAAGPALGAHCALICAVCGNEPAGVLMTDAAFPPLVFKVSTWTKQYRASAHRSIPAMDQLSDWLSNSLPSADSEVTLVHGDYRIDNLIFHPTEARVLAVLDWELSTTGQPTADLAYFLMPHYCPSHLGAISTLGGITGIEGIPPPEDLISIYCRCRGIPPSLPHQNFFIALAMFKMACIAQGIYARFLLGNASAPDAAQYGETVEPLAQLALNIAHSSSPAVPCSDRLFLQSPRGQAVLQQIKQFMRQHVLPAQQQITEYYTKHAGGAQRWQTPPVLEELKAKARAAGLWNLFLPAVSGLSQVDYSYIAEETGRCSFAPEVFNCQAPDSGNMEVLHLYGSEEQKKRWLEPLLRAEIRSCFCMTGRTQNFHDAGDSKVGDLVVHPADRSSRIRTEDIDLAV